MLEEVERLRGDEMGGTVKCAMRSVRVCRDSFWEGRFYRRFEGIVRVQDTPHGRVWLGAGMARSDSQCLDCDAGLAIVLRSAFG